MLGTATTAFVYDAHSFTRCGVGGEGEFVRVRMVSQGCPHSLLEKGGFNCQWQPKRHMTANSCCVE